jgi:hypothetical protein
MATRPLPTVVGPTEKALRTLLGRILTVTNIGGYAEWVYLNIRSAAGDGVQVDMPVADALKQPVADVMLVRQRLESRGLIDPVGGLTQSGQDELRHGRELVAAMTEKLTDGIDPARLEVAADVLDTVRRRAEEELSC